MCGIGGVLEQNHQKIPLLNGYLEEMNRIQRHRGPDGKGIWRHREGFIGLSHQRLSIIDLENSIQPMEDCFSNVITYNGEIYNFEELREELKGYPFKTRSDTEVILASYEKWGTNCVRKFRGMFAFAIWDEKKQRLFAARDRFGIKPFYYTLVDNCFIFASEVKTLIPFLPEFKIDYDALKDYFVFQFCLGKRTLIKGIEELDPAHTLIVEKNGKIKRESYWEVYYHLDFDHTEKYFNNKLQHLIEDSIKFHLKSDVPVGGYVSGGTDSGIISAVASHFLERDGKSFMGFSGRFDEGEEYDESFYAESISKKWNFELNLLTLTSQDFVDSIETILYHLDFPVAGPGAFPQYHVSKMASQSRKVLLGGQGGDEIFGGYTRYLIAYFEQCIKSAIEGTTHLGNFIVTYESIIPNLAALQNYKPLLKHFFKEGLFESLDKRYYRLIDRSSEFKNEILWNELGSYSPFENFIEIFHGSNVGKESYFDKMTHFDFKTLLPALLHVEDRMSMAHGVESRVPFLDHPLVEFAATMPSNIKFKDGSLKRILIESMRHWLPQEVSERKNKMGFPVPLNEWLKKDLKPFIHDLFSSKSFKERGFFDQKAVLENLNTESKFGRKVWGIACLELWLKIFSDTHREKKELFISSAKQKSIQSEAAFQKQDSVLILS